MAPRGSAAFRYGEVALLRASTDPGGLDLPRDLAADNAAGQVAWLSQLWRRAEVRQAVEAASPALSVQVKLAVSGRYRNSDQVRRVVVAVGSYLLRWQRRATPFGLFAGTGLARVGGSARAGWGGQRVTARADAAWLGDVVSRLHACPELMDRLSVVASDAAVERGARVAAPGPVPDGPGGELAAVEVSVRRTRSAAAALDAAREPVIFGDLARRLAVGFPTASEDKVRELLATLVGQGLLVSALRAPMTETDVLGYLLARLGEAGADGIARVRSLVADLTAVYEALGAGRPGGTVPDLGVAGMMRKVSGSAETPVVLDTVLDFDLCVPAQVAEEACAAAGVLHRMSPCPPGHPAWTEYRQRFTRRYGTGTLVPVLELTGDSGLGFPSGYLGAARELPARAVTGRDIRILELVQRAAAAGTGEIVVDERVIEDLTAGTAVMVPGRAEIAVEVRAGSLEELGWGRFTLAVTGTPRPGSSMIGRHAGLLGSVGRDLASTSFAAGEPGTVAAQMSFGPRKRRNENVARTARFLPLVIPVGEHRPPGDRVIPLRDLAVAADDDRFYLVRLTTGELVEPRVTHALEAGTHTPPLARFLAEVTTAHCAVYQGFDYGVAGRLPYLPRVRYRRTVLAPARWLLAAGELPGADATVGEWDDALEAWRSRWQVPDHVAMTEADRRQPVDLSHPFHRALLRERLRRAGRLELRETAVPAELGWIGRAHELVVALRSVRPAPAPSGRPFTLASADDGRPVVLAARLQAHPARFDEILAGHVSGLVTALGASPWWFDRPPSRDVGEGPCLGIYLALPGLDGYADRVAVVTAWAERLRRAGLAAGITVSVREPWHARFGGTTALSGAYRVFAADSAAALAQLAMAAREGLDTRAVAAASMTSIAAGFAGSAGDGMQWLLRALPREHGITEPGLRDQALRLADPSAAAGGPSAVDDGVLAGWKERTYALAAYRQVLDRQRDPVAVLGALLRDHGNRMTGSGTPMAVRLARACALRYLAAWQPEAVPCP